MPDTELQLESNNLCTYNSFSNNVLMTELPFANVSSCLLQAIKNGTDEVAGSASKVYKKLKMIERG